MSQTNINTNDCWVYAGRLNDDGYAIYPHRVNGSVFNERLHRVTFEKYIGKIPNGLVIDHLCRVRCCINPIHLEPVTSRENIIRGHSSRNEKLRNCCFQGHEYTSQNTTIRKRLKPSGNTINERVCRKCANIRVAKKYYRDKEKVVARNL